MSAIDDQLAAFCRYAALIESTLKRTGAASALDNAPLDGAAGVLAKALGLTETPVRLPEVLQALRDQPIADRIGHARPVYRPLALHACVCAFEFFRRSESATQTRAGAPAERPEPADIDRCIILLDDACQQILQRARQCDNLPWPPRAADGPELAALAWEALVLYEAGRLMARSLWSESAGELLGRFVEAQQPSGALLETTGSDNPETHWYHELVLLHALAGYAVRGESRPGARAACRAAAYHLNETQPDHATTQPWGLFAFLWNPESTMLADSLLHAQQTQHPSAPDPVATILLADTLLCLRLYPQRAPET